MERSRKILHKIASASHKVVDVANKYADRKDSNSVSRWHFQLEKDMRRISVACECLAGILSRPSPGEDSESAVDVRVQDWLVTDEPQDCLDTLCRMESLLRRSDGTPSWMSRVFRRQGWIAGTQDKIKEVVDLFNSCKGYFHFLFSTDIWNNERVIQGPSDQVVARVHAQKEFKSVMPLGVDVYRGHAEHITQERPIINTEGLPAGDQDDASAIVRETTHDQDEHGTTYRGREMKTDEQRRDEEKKFEEMLEWLNGLNCAEKQDATLLLRQEDTCKWLFDATQYKAWKDGKIETLWLQGKPGAGKSVLASFVVDSFKKTQRDGEILIFFYCDFRNERSTSSAEVMRSILSQVLRQLRSVDLGSVFNDLMKAKEWGGGTLGNAKELAGFVSRAARLSSQKPLVVVDALDECKDVQKLIRALMLIRDHVRLFVTSRPLQVIMDELLGIPFVSMEEMADRLAADIKLHVTRELDARRRLRDLESGFKMEIRTVLCNKADGMFRWVQCSIDTLVRCVTRMEVRNALQSLPKGLEETYERILLAIDTETLAGQLARRALIWLVAALRPLKLSEIMEALSINLEARVLDSEIGPMHSGALLDTCGSLVTYTEKTGIIILSHSSVKEYLMGEFTRAKLQRYHINFEHAHLLLIRSCMCYISICLKRAQGSVSVDSNNTATSLPRVRLQLRLHPKSEPLLDYALDDALDHFRYLGSTFKSSLRDVTVLAQDIERYSWVWDHVCIPARWETKAHWPASMHDLLLYILVAFAPNSFIITFFRHNALKPKEGTNPLVYAAQFDKDEHVRTLLLRGSKLNHRGWETSGFRQSLPIEVAFRNRHYSVVTQFINEGSVVPPHMITTSFFTHRQFINLPSSIARVLSQTDEFAENIHDCLNEKAWRAMKTSRQLLVLRDTTEQDLIGIIRRYLQIADEHFTPNSIKEAFLRFAVSQGYFSAARYLLTLGTTVPSDLLTTFRDLRGKWKTAPMIKFLSDNGADILVRMSSGESVLHAIFWVPDLGINLLVNNANEEDILEAVNLLVDCGCDPLEADFSGNPLLHAAIEQGYVSVARYFLSLGVPLPPHPFVTMKFGWTTPMIHFLVENGADVLARTSGGDSLIHVALQHIYDDVKALEILKLLIGYGCDPLEANLNGDTPLHIASQQCYISVVQHLLALGARVPPDLLVASETVWMTAPMIRLLVENGADVLARTSSGDSLLHIICRSLDDGLVLLEAVKLLLSYGCGPMEANTRGNTPLCTAVERGFTSVVHLLTAGGPLPSDLFSTLNRGRIFRTVRMIRFVVENEMDVFLNASSGQRESLLHLALRSCYSYEPHTLEIVKFLVGAGSNPTEVDVLGHTPLHIAIEKGCTCVARYLLTLGAQLSPDLCLPPSPCNISGWKACMIQFLVENGFNIFAQASSGEPMLHVALLSMSLVYGDSDALEAVKFLVAHGCDPLESDSSGYTPLDIALKRDHISTAQYLLTLGAHIRPDSLVAPKWRTNEITIRFLVENGADTLAHTGNGDSVLHVLLRSARAERDALKVVEFLVSQGCDPFEVNPPGDTPLHIAVTRGYTSVARYLLTLGAPLLPDILPILNRDSLVWCKASMIRLLAENGVNVLARASNGDSILHIALKRISFDDSEILKLKVLIDCGCDPLAVNHDGHTPVHIAVECGKTAAAQYLLRVSGTPLPPDLLLTLNLNWYWRDTLPMIHFLIENGVNVLAPCGSNGDSLLHVALQRRCILKDDSALEATKLLIRHGCDPLQANTRGETPLHVAASGICIPVVKYLLTQGANVLGKTSNGDTVLHLVTSANCAYHDEDLRVLEAVQLFVGCGCEPALPNNDGETPLHNAINQGHIMTTCYLLSPNFPLPHDILFTAISQSDHMHNLDVANRQVIETLVTSGCDTQTPKSEGDTPLLVTIKKGEVDVVQYLLCVESMHKPPLKGLSAVELLSPYIKNKMRDTILVCYRGRRALLVPLKRARHL